MICGSSPSYRIPAPRRGGDPLGQGRSRGTDDIDRHRTHLRPNPKFLVCMGVDVDSGFSGSTYQ
ncbi:hypothetical protein ROP_pROB01-02510 (plasmid) [Rhodococcus opacus B4]|uniref:Uncharacterized protein n=1 Tax=Rhodococcus opacus (strain B4) TaxID=632772 RepID=C1BD06_RHOOB|nr:hypothetical protein ROP_pROB01-02510 [Rhodococcus opacus B4]